MLWMKLMLRVKEVIVVEGRYDKNTLSQIVDAVIIETKGFGIFSDKENLSLLRRLAETRGLIVFTDSDGAGFVIRGHIKGAIKPEYVKHAYIPDIDGKEKRKTSPSKEGKLGVEGMSRDVIITALRRAGATFDGEDSPIDAMPRRITKTDMFVLGLSGKPDSSAKRLELLKRLSLPQKLSPNGLLDVLNALMSRDELFAMYRD